MNKCMTITASGDSLIMKRIPKNYPGFEELSAFFKQGDACLTNLETTISDGTLPPNAFSGGTWLTTGERVLSDLLTYGFNMVGWGNNHTLDYAHKGVISTKKALNDAGVVHAGAGESLYEASKAGILDTPKGRIGLIAICSTINPAAVAGEQTPSQPGRPGLNPLRYSEIYQVKPERIQALKEIAKATRMNASHDMSVAAGFDKPDPDGIVRFGKMLFKEGETDDVITKMNAVDMARVERMIKDALRTCQYVVVMTHSHEIRHGSDNEAAEFLEQFAHGCIDAGACAVIGGGTHHLKPIELYKGKPIFYSLGNFIFQNSEVSLLPADFARKYGLPLDATASECIAARTAGSTASLHDNPVAYQTVIPRIEMVDDDMVDLTLLPVSLGLKLTNCYHGWPAPADDQTSKEILAYLQRISARYGTEFTMGEDNLIHVTITK